MLTCALREGGALPSVSLLRSWTALEASAARALDRCAPERVVTILHADDSIFVASSAGELQRTLDAVVKWADIHNARFHGSESKSVIMSLPRSVDSPPLFTLGAHSGCDSQSLHYKNIHRWLGVLWPHDLLFCAALKDSIGRASAACSPLLGLVTSHAIPLTFAMDIFEVKVDSVLRVARWLYGCCPAAQSLLDELFESWARLFIGAEPWRNSAVARSELGWHLTGFARAVGCMAMRRARLWLKGADDWYASFFMRNNALGIGWSGTSLSLMRQWGVEDWPAVADSCGTYSAYHKYVSASLTGACGLLLIRGLANHSAQVPYCSFQDGPSHVLLQTRGLNLPWVTQLQLRGWIRLRAGLACLRALGGRRSNAKFQRCIFCNRGVRNGTVHAVGCCSEWDIPRGAFTVAVGAGSNTPDKICGLALSTVPGAAGFVEAVALCHGIDRGATQYWKDVSHDRACVSELL